MSAGSSLAAVKARLKTVLEARGGLSGIPVSIDPPRAGTQLQATNGAYEAIWFANATADVAPPHLGTPVTLDETIRLEVVVQVLKVGDTASTQAAADTRATALLGEVIGALCNDPDLTVSESGVTVLDVLPAGWEHATAWVGIGDGHGSRYVVDVEVNARLNIT